MSQRRALVTGAAGFVGARLAERLLREGARVTLAVRPGSDLWRLAGVAADVEIRSLDLRDEASVRTTLAETRPDWVFHLAAHGAYSWQTDADTIFATNLHGTVRLAQAAVELGVGAFVHAGSSSEYGFKDHAPSEDEAPEPNSWYAVAKAAATMSLQHLAAETDQPLTTLRLASVYGPWEEPRRLIPALLTHALQGSLPPLGSPEIGRDFVYVDDVCDAFLAVAEAGPLAHRIYNVGTGRQTSLGELVALVRSLLAVEAEPIFGRYPPRSWDTKTWVSDPRRMRADLGWQARTGLGDGLSATVAWLRGRPELAGRYRVEAS